MAAPDGPPDLFGIGRLLGVAAGVLFALRLGQGARTWWARRRRDRELQAQRDKRRQPSPPAAGGGSAG